MSIFDRFEMENENVENPFSILALRLPIRDWRFLSTRLQIYDQVFGDDDQAWHAAGS